MNKGHWFCLDCDDVVHMPAPLAGNERLAHLCGVCRKQKAMWITDAEAEKAGSQALKKVTAEFAANYFAEIRKTIKQG